MQCLRFCYIKDEIYLLWSLGWQILAPTQNLQNV